MSTKKLAKELGLLRQRSQSSNGSKKALVSNQIFSYIIVIDFESTCWREKNNYTQEIIEFPAVLLNTSTGEVESEFHTYVQPQEHPILSEFCTELTGITQTQVEAGIPLQICLSRFSRWLQNLQLNMGVVFPNRPQTSSGPSPSQKLCTFLTWSDWDLGVCLQYECKRKQLHKPDVLNSWIDLRCTYKLFYDRKPKGLNGALQDLGIQFSGREHSGLDDARNTAQLAARMMRDGCVMKITRSLVRTPLMAIPVCGNATADNTKEKSNTNKEKNKPALSKITPKSCSESIIRNKNPRENSTSVQESVQMRQSLISPKTLLNGTMVMRNYPSPQNNNNRSLVLCSTTVSCLSNVLSTGTVEHMEEEEGAEVLVETEDRCGSYDDVVLEADTVSGGTEASEFGVDYVSDFDSECHVWEEPDITHLPGGQVTSRGNIRETASVRNHFKTQTMTSESSMSSVSTKKMKSHVNVSKYVEIRLDSVNSEPSTSFAIPRAVNKDSKSNQHKTGPKGSALLAQGAPSDLHKNTKINTQSCFRLKPFIPEKTSTPNTSFAVPKAVVTQHAKHKPAPKSSFTIFADPEKPSRPSSGGSHSTSKNMLSFLSTNTLSSAANRSSICAAVKAGQRVTSPLCACGRRAKRQVVSNGGPNHGRGFYCCPVRRSGSGGTIQKGCEFFKWESALMKSSPAASPAVRSSVSLCHINSTLSSRPLHRSNIRKSY